MVYAGKACIDESRRVIRFGGSRKYIVRLKRCSEAGNKHKMSVRSYHSRNVVTEESIPVGELDSIVQTCDSGDDDQSALDSTSKGCFCPTINVSAELRVRTVPRLPVLDFDDATVGA
jgi:hypothetical protein